MSDWKPRRFWKIAETSPEEGGFAVKLDGRPLRTPAKAPLVLPSQALAARIAAEWDAQEDQVDPGTMPVTRMANSAIDKVAVQFPEVAEMLVEYGDADLLCYRADSPVELVARQADAWDPMLEWASRDLGARLEPRNGVIHVAQDPAALEVLRLRVHQKSPFELAAFHDLVALSGSLVLGFAAFLNKASASEIWQISRIDETWQEEQWGADEEATAMAEHKMSEFQNAANFLKLLRA